MDPYVHQNFQIPCICMSWVCDPLWVGLKPHCLRYGIICRSVVTHDLCWFLKSGLAPASIMKRWWIHMPINCICQLWNTFIFMAWTCDPLWVGLKPDCLCCCRICSFVLICQIWASTCHDNEVVMDPYAHPLHMNVVKHLVYVWPGCVIHSGWVWSLIACVMVWIVAKLWSRICADLSKWWIHMPIHCIWVLSNTLYMYDMDVWSTLGGS